MHTHTKKKKEEKRGTKVRGNNHWFSGVDNERHYCVGHGKL